MWIGRCVDGPPELHFVARKSHALCVLRAQLNFLLTLPKMDLKWQYVYI